jgi:hypothetical protein
LNFPNFFIHDVGEVAFFEQILANQAVGVLVKPSIAGLIGSCEVDFRSELFSDFGVSGELLAIIKCDAVNEFLCFFNRLHVATLVFFMVFLPIFLTTKNFEWRST